MYLLKDVPYDFGPYYGNTFLPLFMFPIPRVVWDEKPVAVGRLILLPFFPEQGGSVGVPLHAELYINFLLLGVIMGMMLFGIISRALYTYLKKNKKNKAAVIIYASVFFHWVVGLMVADFVTITIPVVQNLLTVCLDLFYNNYKRQNKRT